MYQEWVDIRVKKIINIFGYDWFHHKKVLELGACYGDIGTELLKIGADVLFADAREEHLNTINNSLTGLNFTPRTKVINQNDRYDLGETFNLVLHLGVLYHVANWKSDLECALKHTNTMVLETIVSLVEGSQDSTHINNNTYQYDSIDGKEPLFTQESVEQHLTNLGCKFLRFDNSELNTSWSWLYNNRRVRKVYDWNYANASSYIYDPNDSTQFRRMWLVLK
jgi:16S rRNA G966 N2-methylase RsmD